MRIIVFEKNMFKLIKKFVLFLIVGLPAFFVAIPANYVFVEQFSISKPIAYAWVLVMQVTINFFMLRRFVFEQIENASIIKQFLKFIIGISIFRLCDWLLYYLVVEFTSIYYLIVQISNVIIFSVAKYFYSKMILEVN